MSRRRMVIRDLFCIIAHGTVSARLPAAHLLFHYWPALNPTSADRRNNLLKFTGQSQVSCCGSEFTMFGFTIQFKCV